MKQVFLGLLLVAAVSTSAFAGSCDHSWQTASDGSACGGRAADQKPGGK